MKKIMLLIKDWYLLFLLPLLIAFTCYIHYKNTQETMELLSEGDKLKVFSLDWGLSADLISLEVTPVAVANQTGYKNWVGKPLIPESSIEVGLRSQPNPELMANLNLDIILDNDFYSDNRSIYNKTADIKSIEYGRDTQKIDEVPKWSTFATDMTKLGEYVNKSDIAENYIFNSKKAITQAGVNIKKNLGDNRQFLIVSLFDTSELQVYNINHSVNLSMTMMDLKLLPMGELSEWGTSSVPFHKILDVPDNTCLVIIEPLNPFVGHELKESLIWQQSEFSKFNACVYRIKPIWMYGSFSTVKNFAFNLEQEISNPRKTNLSVSTVEEQK